MPPSPLRTVIAQFQFFFGGGGLFCLEGGLFRARPPPCENSCGRPCLSWVLSHANIGGRMGELVNHLSYANDICLICLSSAGMQTLLNVCSKYATEHSLSYNANKSYSLCFKATIIKFKRPTLHIGQINISNVTDCRYLGITTSVKNCDLDLKRQMRKCYAKANLLLRKFVKCSPDVKCYLFLKLIVVTCTVQV